MSIGGSHVRFSLCYIDDLLVDFSQQPQKSIQFVFQRLLVACGSECRSISVHAADVLLSAVGLVNLPPPPRRALDDHSACVLLALILKFATEEQPGRTHLELNGASALFTAVVDRVSSEIQKISEEGGSQLVPLIETILNKVKVIVHKSGFYANFIISVQIFQSVDQVHQCAFLVSLAVGDASFVVSSLLEQLLHNFFIKHVQSQFFIYY
uniref:DCB domain-containing protein n=1 Tax=Heterorhabditis bacteriophora TaxID=37862 RepID=A0A1I7X9A3_HETBA